MTMDPVCGRSISPKQSEYLATRNGKTHHFCCAICKQQFLDSYQPAAVLITANDLAAAPDGAMRLSIREPEQPIQASRQVAIAV